MSHEVPEISLKEMLLVPEGPPAAVWERALEAAFAGGDQEEGTDGASSAVAAAAVEGEPDVDFDADDEGDDPDGDAAPPYDFAATPDPTFDADDSGADGWYSGDAAQGDGDDVEY